MNDCLASFVCGLCFGLAIGFLTGMGMFGDRPNVPAPPTIFDLVGLYSNAVGRYGPDSPEARAIREAHANNAEFIGYADALDRIKRHLQRPTIT